MKTALITGMTGQDGTYLAGLLAGKGYRVVGLSRSVPASTAPSPHVEHRALDVTDFAALESAIAAVNPSEIYHLAAQSSVGLSFERPLETFRSIALGTANVLEAARRVPSRPRVLVASSGEAFGDTGGAPADETTPLRPLNPYSAAKAAASELAQSYRASFGVHASVVYLYNHESPLRGSRFVTRKIARGACRIARGLERTLELGDISVVRDWGWAEEYVAAMWSALSLPEPDDFVIASGESISLERFVEAAFEHVGLRARDHVVTTKALFRSVDIPVMRANPAHAREKLGWQATIRGTEVAKRLVEAELRAEPASAGA